MIREDQHDLIYKTEEAKFEAVVEDIAERHATGQPSWSAPSPSRSRSCLSEMLKQPGHAPPGAERQVSRERGRDRRRGRPAGAVTIATNMAGRGTDILLGGNPEFLAQGEAARSRRSDAADTWLTAGRDRPSERRRRDEPDSRSAGGDGEACKRATCYAEFKQGDRRRAGEGAGAGRPLHLGHGAAREPPHRQPAAGPRRPPGRPGHVPLLRLAGRRSDAPFRLATASRTSWTAWAGRRTAHRAHPDHPGHRERAEGGEPQLRDPQACARVRRRDEQAARGDLRAAGEVLRARISRSACGEMQERCADAWSTSTATRRRIPRSGIWQGLARAVRRRPCGREAPGRRGELDGPGAGRSQDC